MKKLLAAVVTGAVVAALAVPALAATKTVRVDDNAFRAGSVTIAKGDTVRFRWVGTSIHNVTRASGPTFKRITNRTSGTVSRRFTRAGTYTLVCTVHPGMNLKIKVR